MPDLHNNFLKKNKIIKTDKTIEETRKLFVSCARFTKVIINDSEMSLFRYLQIENALVNRMDLVLGYSNHCERRHRRSQRVASNLR